MPTLPLPEPDPPTRIDRVRDRVRQALAPAQVTSRLMVLMVFAVVGSSMAPIPWNQIALIALLGIGIDVARTRVRG